MLLSDGEIWESLETRHIVIDPYPNISGLVQASSVDLRLSGDLLVHRDYPVEGVIIDPATVNVVDHLRSYCRSVDISNGPPFEIRSNSFVIAQTLERVELPLDLAARVEGRSSLARFGLTVHITAPKIDPGFNGNITLEMFNLGPFALKLSYGMRICSLTFERLGRPANRGYRGRFQTR